MSESWMGEALPLEMVRLLEREAGPDWREMSFDDVRDFSAHLGARIDQLEAELAERGEDNNG